jgi:hypothetical protein
MVMREVVADAAFCAGLALFWYGIHSLEMAGIVLLTVAAYSALTNPAGDTDE